MLSLFAPTETTPPEPKVELRHARRNRRPSLITAAPPTASPVAPFPQQVEVIHHHHHEQQSQSATIQNYNNVQHAQQHQQQQQSPMESSSFLDQTENDEPPVPLEEVEITGLELLQRSRSKDYDDDAQDSFSYESYALDSFALAGHPKNPNALRYIQANAPRRRRLSADSSSFGLYDEDDDSPHINMPQQNLSRRDSNESFSSDLDYDDYYGYSGGGGRRQQQRRGSVGSFANDSLDRNRQSGKNFSRKQKATTSAAPPRPMPIARRSSTGTNDLPGFGRYKARKESTNIGNDLLRRSSLGSLPQQQQQIQQRIEMFVKAAAASNKTDSLMGAGSSHSLPRRLSMKSMSSLGSRRLSMSSLGSGFSSGARPRH